MTDNAKWTEGPWTVCDKDHGSGWGIDGPEGEAVVWWPASDEPENGIPLEPDAHLIASAPEIYDALCAIVEYADDVDPCFPGLGRARTALAKARGETQ